MGLPIWLKAAGTSVLLLGGLYGAGLGIYVVTLPQPFTALPPKLEGLAVLTGGAGRIETTLRLVQGGFEGPVLISGAHPQNALDDILAASKLPEPLTLAQRQTIMLDVAASTRENLGSVKVWAAATNLRRIGIVTSTYHAARVRLLAWWQTPELEVHVLPVEPEDQRLIVLLREYHKLLAAPLLQ